MLNLFLTRCNTSHVSFGKARLPNPLLAFSSRNTCRLQRDTLRHLRGNLRLLSAATESASVPEARNLADLDLFPIVNSSGVIFPDNKLTAQAYVYAVYDDKYKLQYVGFSKDLRNSLRTVFGRRPDKAFYYKFVELAELNQNEMVSVRDRWFSEVGGPPPGNKLALERASWQQPVDAGAISERGKQGAAEEKLRQLLQAIKDRGCKEEFVPDTKLLSDGQVDFLLAKALTTEELNATKEREEMLRKNTGVGTLVFEGQEREFKLMYTRQLKTNGGYLMDVTIIFDNKETQHRVIVGKDYYEPYNLDPRKVLEACFSIMLANKLPRQTDGLITSSQFPSNYFAVSELEQWHKAEFKSYMDKLTSTTERTSPEFYMFNRVHDYGFKLEREDEWAFLSKDLKEN